MNVPAILPNQVYDQVHYVLPAAFDIRRTVSELAILTPSLYSVEWARDGLFAATKLKVCGHLEVVS